MANETSFEPKSDIREYLAWEYPERPRYRRGVLWYALMLVVGLGLLIYAVYSANFLFALIIIMFALVIYVTTTIDPGDTRFSVTDEGIEAAGRIYGFRDIDRFWFYYDPPVKSLYLIMRGAAGSRLRVDLVDQDPNEVRAILGQFVREDLEQIDEPISDILSRIIKL